MCFIQLRLFKKRKYISFYYRMKNVLQKVKFNNPMSFTCMSVVSNCFQSITILENIDTV